MEILTDEEKNPPKANPGGMSELLAVSWADDTVVIVIKDQ